MHRSALLLGTLLLLFSARAAGQVPPSDKDAAFQSPSLRLFWTRVCQESPKLRQADLRQQQADLTRKAVSAQRWLPLARLELKTGLVPGARGTVLYSPDSQSDLDNLGPFVRADLSLSQPILTFGRTRQALNISQATRDLAHQKGNQDRFELFREAVRIYWALGLSQEGEKDARDLDKSYHKLLDEVRKAVNDPESEVSDSQRLEVESAELTVVGSLEEARSLTRDCLLAFQQLGGWTGDSSVTLHLPQDPDIGPILNQAFQDPEQAWQHHPIQQGLIAGLALLQARMAFEKAQRAPLVYGAAGFRWARAPGRDDQKNPFVWDEFNATTLGAFIGLTWDLNTRAARVKILSAQLEHQMLEEQAQDLKRQFHWFWSHSRNRLEQVASTLAAGQRSVRAARSWMRLSLENWDEGLGELSQVIKATQTFHQLSAQVLQKRLLFHQTLADAALALGDEDHYLRWIQHDE